VADKLSRSFAFAVLIFSISIVISTLPTQSSSISQETIPEFPLFTPNFFIYSERIPNQVFEGDNVELVATLINEHRVSADIIFLTQIVNSRGIAEEIQQTRSSISASDETARLVNQWHVEQDDNYRVDAFILKVLPGSNQSDAVDLASEKWSKKFHVRSLEHTNTHKLRIEVVVDNPDNVPAGQAPEGSAVLINDGDQPEVVKIDTAEIRMRPIGWEYHREIQSGCSFWRGGQLHPEFENSGAIILPANGGKHVIHGGGKIWPDHSLDHAHTYQLTWIDRIWVQESDGVNCIFVTSNTVTFNVTAPSYEDLSLVLSTDKQTYTRNETIRFVPYIRNDSDIPIVIEEPEIDILLRDNEGAFILLIEYGGSTDLGPSLIKPNSKWTLDDMQYPPRGPWYWDWDQRIMTREYVPYSVAPGEYFAYATFSSPPMKSEVIMFTIE
jgi:hypothetical protein